LRIWSWH